MIRICLGPSLHEASFPWGKGGNNFLPAVPGLNWSSLWLL